MKCNIVFSMEKRYLLLIIFSFSIFILTAQDCKSKLASSIKPISENSIISTGFELGFLGVHQNNGDMYSTIKLFSGLSFDFSRKHSFYFEGGIKRCERDVKDSGIYFQCGKKCYQNIIHYGLREAFYNYFSENTIAKIGFQTMISNDYFLVNERSWGLTITQKIESYSFYFSGFTVVDDFAKNGRFCGNKCLLSSVFHNREYDVLGKNYGDTNFISFVIKKDFSYEKKKLKSINKNSPEILDNDFSDDEFSDDEFSTDEFASDDEFSDDEFSTDEFASDDEFSDDEFSNEEFSDNSSHSKNQSKKKKSNLLKEVGLIYYSEFGNSIVEKNHYFGAFTSFNFPLGLRIKSEILTQIIDNNDMLIGYFEAKKRFVWENGENTNFSVKLYRDIIASDDAVFSPRFTNIFLGEVLRFDANRLPLVYKSIKHNFRSKKRIFVQLKMLKLLTESYYSEIDFLAGITINEKLNTVFTTSLIRKNADDNPIYMLQLDLRYALF